MKNVLETVRTGMCTGCMACLSLCPNDNLVMKEGKLGFPVPHIKNEELCRGCSKCVKGCPMSNEDDE